MIKCYHSGYVFSDPLDMGSQEGVTKCYCLSLISQIRDLVPESQAYMDLLAFERKLDATIMRKRLEIQEGIRRPMKQKRKLRVFITHVFSAAEPEGGGGEVRVNSLKLRDEGRTQ